jgi:hypothetical protein
LLQTLNTTTTYDQLKSTYLDHYHRPLDANEMHRLFGCKHPLVAFYRHFSNEIKTECNDSGLIMLTLRVKRMMVAKTLKTYIYIFRVTIKKTCNEYGSDA